MNLATWVERNGRRFRQEPALAVGERVHTTWGEFAARTAAAGLRDSFGLFPGDRVAIVMSNRADYLEVMTAVWHAGLVVVPVNARLHRDEIAYVLADSGSAVVVTNHEHAIDVQSRPSRTAPGYRGWGRARSAPPRQGCTRLLALVPARP